MFVPDNADIGDNMVDVNEQFEITKLTQIADARQRQEEIQNRIANGGLTPLGGNRYRVNGGWDNGEVITIHDGAVVAEHGLDTSTGKAALYSRVPAWHSLGTIVPEGITDVDEVLRSAGLDFGVALEPVKYAIGDRLNTLPNKYVTVRMDTNAGLGVVGGKYEVVQNGEALAFLGDLCNMDNVIFESAGALNSGATVFVCMELPDHIVVDADGVNDEIKQFIMVTNSHDGKSPVKVVVTPWRPMCGNTERFAIRDAVTSWSVRHTATAMSRINEARTALKMSSKYFANFGEEMNMLAQRDITMGEFDAIIKRTFGELKENASKKAVVLEETRREKIDALFASNMATLGRTAYAAERALTEYADWGTQLRQTDVTAGLSPVSLRAIRLVNDTAATYKNRVHEAVMALV
jgi:phage/plasmid-like protein (TIGR03299 family)